MKDFTFVTGNQGKADYLAKFLGLPVNRAKLDLDELQSLDLCEVVEHKVRQAYGMINKPVIVEDVTLEFSAFGRLPGTFIKFFLEEMTLDDICSLLDGKNREATARCVFGYYDGAELKLFEGSMKGVISETPSGDGGYGWDKIFIPEGYEITGASLCEEDDRETYLIIKPIKELREFLSSE